MSYNGHFDFTDFTSFDNNNVGCGNSGAVDDLFNIFQEENNTSLGLFNNQYAGPSTMDETWYLQSQETGCTSQSYTGAEVFGDLSCFPDLGHNTIATGTQCQGNGAVFDEGHNSQVRARKVPFTRLPQPAAASYNNPAFSSIPTLPCGFRSPAHALNAASTPSARDPAATTRVIHYSGDLGYGYLPTAGPSSLATALPPSPSNPTEEGAQLRFPDSDPFGFLSSPHFAPSHPIPGTTPTGVPFKGPVASSGPQRTGKRAELRKFNPIRSAKKKADADERGEEAGWNVTLLHFRAQLQDTVWNGQPPGGSQPEKALVAKVAKFVKEDLKRSPLQKSKAGEGKRPRNVEDYLTGVLREVDGVKTASTSAQGGLDENSIKMAVFERLADVLEARLVAVNQRPALRRPTNNPELGKGTRLQQTEGRVNKNKREKSKRDLERHHLERISYLFKVAGHGDTWTRVDVLCFGAILLLCGPAVFSPGFVEVASN